jgi:WD40 repeat protein
MDNLERTEPGLILETGGRTGSCDVLRFTRSGDTLIAAGDDKVVRLWPCAAGGLEPERGQTLRWSIWREQRGSIYALALDAEERRVAVGGFGVRTGTVMVLDRATGKVLHALTDTAGNDQTIRALAFAPSGKRLAFGTGAGTVWVWDLERPRAEKLGESTAGRKVNRVRFLAFRGEDSLLSLAEDGKLIAWDAIGRQGPQEQFRVEADGGKVSRAAAGADRLAVSVLGRGGNNRIDVYALERHDARPAVSIPLPEHAFADCLALDKEGRRLAVAIGSARRVGTFHDEAADVVVVHDLDGRAVRETARLGPTYSVDALAFHPGHDWLAIAGGDNHEVTLWGVATGQPVGKPVVGAGRCLWGVGLSEDGKRLGFRDQRAVAPEGPNARSEGPWRVFDLERRRWARDEAFRPVKPISSADNWTVEGGEEFATWYVVGPDRQRYVLPLDEAKDQFPRCYTFLRATGTRPTRLAVGHYYGATVFALGRDGPTRERLLTGHADYVMALAPSADGQWLVSASRDKTVAAWSLEDWPSQAELGAAFAEHDGRVLVEKVDEGSPAWEGRLTAGDEVSGFWFNVREFIYDAAQAAKGGPSAAECVARLRRPVPGQEFAFLLKRPGQAKLIPAKTSVRQRPQWRFFPGGEREWVLWLYWSYYYDTSTYGDYLIGWHVNDSSLDREPAFYQAEQFRHRFQRPDLMEQLLWSRRVEGGLRNMLGIEPPVVSVEPERPDVAGTDGVRVRVAARVRDRTKPDQELEAVELWVEDHLFRTWKAAGPEFADEVTVPRDRLRSGSNQLTLQCVNRAKVRGEAVALVGAPQRTSAPRLYGLMVGVDDYSKALLPPRFPKKLDYPEADARALRQAWLEQRGKLYDDADPQVLLGPEVTRDAIREWLRDLAGRVRPDDRLVLFLGGHGYADPEQRDSFLFFPSTFDRRNPGATGLSSQELYRELARLSCQKLVLLDVCRAGMAANPVRSLTPGGKGPRILASCDRDEAALEAPRFEHGLFAYAVLEAVGKEFAAADRNRDGRLDAAELFRYTEERLPALLKQVGVGEDAQNPTRFPRTPDGVSFVGK